MKLKLKEDPREWRKSVLFGALGLALLSSLLRWRRVLPAVVWIAVLMVLTLAALLAVCCPRWFRGYYRFTSRAGFYITQFLGRILLTIVFLVLVTPLGLLLRMLGKDPLRLKRPKAAETYWTTAKPGSPLERLF
jgi:hypothetical protein